MTFFPVEGNVKRFLFSRATFPRAITVNLICLCLSQEQAKQNVHHKAMTWKKDFSLNEFRINRVLSHDLMGHRESLEINLLSMQLAVNILTEWMTEFSARNVFALAMKFVELIRLMFNFKNHKQRILRQAWHFFSLSLLPQTASTQRRNKVENLNLNRQPRWNQGARGCHNTIAICFSSA